MREFSKESLMTIESILNRITKTLCDFINVTLKNEEDYFKKNIKSALSFKQRQTNPKKIEDLDLASLIRVVEKNIWNLENNYHVNFSRDYQNYCREMTSIRNKYAHKTSKKFNIDDEIRDLDTIYRFLLPLERNSELLKEIKNLEKNLRKKVVSKVTDEDRQQDQFAPGKEVIIKSEPAKKAIIMEKIPSEKEEKYKVFVDNTTKEYYKSQLTFSKKEDSNELKVNDLKYLLTSIMINNPDFATLYSLNSAKIDFIPYQFRPVFKIIHSDRPKLLLADSVGVGKTIEAGLILKELQSRQEIESILIICPKALVAEKKWQYEMRKFDEEFIELDRRTLRYCTDETDFEGEWPEKYKKVIIPFSLLDEDFLKGNKKKNSKGLEKLNPFPQFDLLIVDEAHHVRNTQTYSHKIVKLFTENSKATLFLTATPMQLHSKELFVLLNLLRPDIFIDEKVFEFMSEPNKFINEAKKEIRHKKENWDEKAKSNLQKAALTEYGKKFITDDPAFQKIYDDINAENTDRKRIELINSAEKINTFYKYINRTRRRDISDFTIREPQTIEIEFTEKQNEIYDAIVSLNREFYMKKFGNNINFFMTTLLRQAASSINGLIPFIDDATKNRINQMMKEEGLDENVKNFEIKLNEELKQKLGDIKKKFSKMNLDDPKIEKLTEIIKQKQEMENNKLMVFSTFRHTLQYINEKLSKKNVRVGLIHGGIKDDERFILRSRFKLDKNDSNAIDVLLFSEVGAEGLDYQFCDGLVNYDLPWNPMKIEQRIGRIDRNGQHSEKILIYNLITPGTIDHTIFYRCLNRINIFNTSVGENEAILGQITKGIVDIALDLQLNEEEKEEKIKQFSDNKYRQIIEEEKLEDTKDALFGIKVNEQIINQEIENATNELLTKEYLENLVKQYFYYRLEKKEIFLGEKNIRTIRIAAKTKKDKSKILNDYLKSNIKKSLSEKKWKKWLKSDENYLKVTFDPQTARQDEDIQLLNTSHPLIKQASQNFDLDIKYYCELNSEYDKLENGVYPFVIYKWEFKGVKHDVKLKVFSENKFIQSDFYNILKTAKNYSGNLLLNNEDFRKFDSLHYSKWQNEKRLHYDKNMEIADYKKESLKKSYIARKLQANDRLENSSDEKITRMYENQIKNIEHDYESRIKKIDESINKADIVTKPVVYGYVVKG